MTDSSCTAFVSATYQVGFPIENLYIDPKRTAYKALELYGDLDGTEGWFFDPKVVEGVRRLFFTKVTGEAIKVRMVVTTRQRNDALIMQQRTKSDLIGMRHLEGTARMCVGV